MASVCIYIKMFEHHSYARYQKAVWDKPQEQQRTQPLEAGGNKWVLPESH